MQLLSQLPIGGIGLGSLVTLVLVLIFKGELVPKSTLEARRADWDAVIEAKNQDIEMLKEAYTMSEKARQINAESDKELLELGRTTVHLLESIHERANGEAA